MGKKVQDAISAIASLKENWSLMAAMDPVAFLEEVATEIKELRVTNVKAEEMLGEMAGQLEFWSRHNGGVDTHHTDSLLARYRALRLRPAAEVQPDDDWEDSHDGYLERFEKGDDNG